jgi:hypothetical protein
VDITPKPVSDDQWFYWEEVVDRKCAPTGARSVREVVAELAAYLMLVDANRDFVSL